MLRKSRTNFCILTVIPFFDCKAFSADKIVEQGRGGGGGVGGGLFKSASYREFPSKQPWTIFLSVYVESSGLT